MPQKKRKRKIQEANASLANASEISVDAAVVAGLLEEGERFYCFTPDWGLANVNKTEASGRATCAKSTMSHEPEVSSELVAPQSASEMSEAIRPNFPTFPRCYGSTMRIIMFNPAPG